MAEKERTRVAVLGTLAEFHREPIPYDMSALMSLVTEINPDLLCLDITPEQWHEQDFSDLPPEYQEALLPLAHQTDIVIAPIGGGQPPSRPEAIGWRGKVINWSRNRIATIQRTASSPDAINQGWRHHLVNYLYFVARLAKDDVEHQLEHTDHLIEEILKLAKRDPGNRALVVVNVQHCHIIRKKLRAFADVEIVTYTVL